MPGGNKGLLCPGAPHHDAHQRKTGLAAGGLHRAAQSQRHGAGLRHRSGGQAGCDSARAAPGDAGHAEKRAGAAADAEGSAAGQPRAAFLRHRGIGAGIQAARPDGAEPKPYHSALRRHRRGKAAGDGPGGGGRGRRGAAAAGDGADFGGGGRVLLRRGCAGPADRRGEAAAGKGADGGYGGKLYRRPGGQPADRGAGGFRGIRLRHRQLQ